MKTHLISSLILVVFILSMSGCPASPSIFLGVWLYSIGPGGYVGVEFLPNGEIDEFDTMNRPHGANANFSGELTWQQVGNIVTVTQDNNGSGRTYVGELTNTTFMTGTWTDNLDPNLAGIFVASKAPSNL